MSSSAQLVSTSERDQWWTLDAGTVEDTPIKGLRGIMTGSLLLLAGGVALRLRKRSTIQ
ncbi:hypothetical protein QP426_01925 [Pauljensenia sp. UMB1235]|uniref:hypothetical protein n=1 Tax=Pauljensenia sp. UMB9872 TaxID=3046352 RepID=UPI0025518DAA|nr:hypothetical protein [Pauljensenia sp. UMB9872]MDK6399911.1 hypothetical protein [Pauljensenia sp. UMB9872]MDK7172432.1 hypothetical protein [Pauljensenia sp. UMB1235]